MKRKRLTGILLSAILAISWSLVHAQSGNSVTGIVKDESGKPLPSVSVTVKKTNAATTTDDNGKFTLQNVAATDTLMFSSVGFQHFELRANEIGTAVTLHKSNSDLNEVVVTALGIKREARSLGYSAQKLTGNSITKASPPDLAQGLIGKSAGLNVTVPNGIQGNSSRIVIRGNNSILGSNQALIVVDGIQIENNPLGGQQNGLTTTSNGQVSSSTDLTSPKDWGSFLNSINSEDIDDVTVLKGATAAALYGARGANGVLLITTKKGSKRSGLGIDYSISALYTTPSQFQDLQNEYGYGGANAMWSAVPEFGTMPDGSPRYPGNYPWDGTPAGDDKQRAGVIPGGFSTWDVFSWYGPGASWGHKLDGTEITWWDGVKRKWDAQPDNRKAFFRTGNTITQNVALSGGGDYGSFRLGFTHTDNTAIIKNSDYNQNTLNFGSNLKLSKAIRAEVTATYTDFNRNNTPDISNDQSWSNFMIYSMSRDYKPLEFNDYINPDGSKKNYIASSPFGYYPYQNNYNQNLFWHLFEQNQHMNRNQLIGSIKLTADATPWLNFTGRASINYMNTSIESKYAPIDAVGVLGQYGIEDISNQDVNLEFFTTFHAENLYKSKLSGSFMIGNTALTSRMYDNSAWNSGEPNATYGQSSSFPWTVPNKYYLSNTTGTIPPPVEAWNNYNLNSLFGILNLSYSNFLYLQVSGRNDWSSTLPVATSSYFYPAVSLSWVFTENIDALKNVNWLNYGKLKASFAKSANGANPYQSTYTYNASVIANYMNGGAPQAFGGQPVRSYQSNLPPASFLEPQRNSSWELGIETGTFNNRLNFEFTYYQSRATSQILSSSLAPSSGASQVTFNTGELENKGIEFVIHATAVHTNDFNWDITLNAAHNVNKVISLASGIDEYPLQDLWGTNGVQMKVKVGEQYGTIYGYDFTYLNGKKVVQRVLDGSGSQTVYGTQYVTTADPVPIGNTNPLFTGGIANTFRYKNFSLYLLTDSKIGGQIFSADYGAAMSQGMAPETLVERNGGGLPYTFPDGTTSNSGVILDGVFADGKANTDVVHYMWKYSGQYAAWSNVKMPRSNEIFTNSWSRLRELNLTYSIPSKALKFAKIIQGLDVSLIGRNLFYIFTTLPDNLNPEAVNGIGNGQGIQWSQYPQTRSIGFAVKVKF